MNVKKLLVLFGVLIVAAVIVAACGGAATETTMATDEVVVADVPAAEVPYLADWQGSGHNDSEGEPFRHWDGDDPAEVPTSCAKCHTTAGFRDFVSADGSEFGSVEAAVPAGDSQGIQCVACHNAATMTLTSVTFPSGAVIEGLGSEARCMTCHQGRESKVSVDQQITDFNAAEAPDTVVEPMDKDGSTVSFGFRNIHYFAAGATLYGSQAQGGYEYDGKIYDAKFRHVPGVDSCVGCHDQHTLEVKVEVCADCHEGVETVEDMQNARMNGSLADYDGDGDVAEGIASELTGLEEILYASILDYAKNTIGTGIVYDPEAYPYWFADADGDGAADQGDNGSVRYTTWTPRLLKAAYNYQVSQKDPGAFAHNAKYIVELLYDSIEDTGGDVSGLARNDPGHFAGDTEAFRHWDEDGEIPGSCSKCHAAEGLKQFVKEGANISNPIANGFLCTNCHNGESWPDRYEVASVKFPSGAEVSLGGKDADGKFVADDANLCITCHQGRESKVSVDGAVKGLDNDTVSDKIRFRNIHYFAAGATLFGADVQGAYLYEGKEYRGQNFHASEEGKMNKCTDCHDVHALEPKVESCETCHDTTDPYAIREDALDYDGDGDTTEGVKAELDGLAEALYAEIQAYAEANSVAIVYDGHSYPYFFDADGKGYAAWTPRLLKAAYNYQYYQKDPGAFAHNSWFVAQFMIDSIQDLGGDVSTYNRP